MNRFLFAMLLSVTAVVSAAEEPTASFLSYTGNDLFPSYIISTASVDWNGDEQLAEDKKTEDDPELEEGETPLFGDENGNVGVELEGVESGDKVTVEMFGDSFLKPSKWKGEIDDDYDSVIIYPKAQWDYDALRQITQQKPANLTIKVTVNGKRLPEIQETVLLRSINECPFYVVTGEGDEDLEDISVTFAAYVNENHPWIDGLLKEALDAAKENDLIDSFTGYQSGDRDVVISQVFAIWNALQRRGIKYSDVSTAPPSKLVYSQTVRFVDDTVTSAQANCVDGSVLMASILRRIGLDAYLVMVPGHCFLAFSDGNKENPTLFGLETTMLGNNNLQPVKFLPKLPAQVKKKEFAASLKTFSAALSTGDERIKEHKDAFESEDDPDIQLISISAARKLGVMPLGAERPKK